MKKIITILLVSVFLVWGSVAFAGDAFDNFVYMISSGEKGDDAQINTGACFFGGFVIETDGSNNGTAQCFDGTDNSGTALTPAIVVISSDLYGGFAPPYPVYCATGIFLEHTGTNCKITVYYRKASSTYKIPVQ